MARSRDESVPVERRTHREMDRPRSRFMQRSHPRGATGPYMPTFGEMMRDPFETMRRMQQDMFGNLGIPSSPRGWMPWSPAIEMFERDEQLVVRAEMPGMRKEDFEVRVMGDSLLIEGERRSENREQNDAYYETEWSYGHFTREIPLPEHVETNDVKARFDNGVLEITLPINAERRQMRTVPIEGGGGGMSRGGSSEGSRADTTRNTT